MKRFYLIERPLTDYELKHYADKSRRRKLLLGATLLLTAIVLGAVVISGR